MQKKVVIVGAGPTGLMMGNLLGMMGIEALILERNSTLSTTPKSISIDDEGLRICQAIGLADQVIDTVLMDVCMVYKSGGKEIAIIKSEKKIYGYPFVSTIHQGELEEILLEGLKRFPTIQVLFEYEVYECHETMQSIEIKARTSEGNTGIITCSYLLACDGGKSLIRHALNIPMIGKDFPNKWLAVDTLQEDRDARYIYTYCDRIRSAVEIAAPRQGVRWEFMLLPDDDEEEMLQPQSIQRLIQEQGGRGNIQIIRQVIYAFHARIAQTFQKGNVFLLGDAAHMMTTFIGQGMNSGLRDAHNLSWKLALVLNEQADPALLRTYQEECYHKDKQMVEISSLAVHIVVMRNRSLIWIRDKCFSAISTFPFIRKMIVGARTKLRPYHKRGCVLGKDSGLPRMYAGRLLPQPVVIGPGEEHILLDTVFKTTFILLCLSEEPECAFDPLKNEIWQDLNVQRICIQTKQVAPVPSNKCLVVVDPDAIYARFFKKRENLFILLRPDRYIFGVFNGAQEDKFVKAFQKALTNPLRQK